MKWVRTCLMTSFAVLSYAAFAINLHAEEKAHGAITVVSHVDIKPDAYLPKAEENSWALFRTETAATKQDAGLVSYVVLQEIGSTNHFTILETWRDKRAYEIHVGSDHTVKFRMEIQPYLGSPFDSRVHHSFD